MRPRSRREVARHLATRFSTGLLRVRAQEVEGVTRANAFELATWDPVRVARAVEWIEARLRQ
jgi:hypothetical protein